MGGTVGFAGKGGLSLGGVASPGKPSMVADRKTLPVFIVKRDCIEEGERALLLWLMRQTKINLKGRVDVLIREAVAIILILGDTGTD